MKTARDLWVRPYDDDRIFPLIRMYLREAVAPRSKTHKPEHIDMVFTDERLRLVRSVGITSYLHWVCSANLYNQKKELCRDGNFIESKT